jgi:acyl dehydratase
MAFTVLPPAELMKHIGEEKTSDWIEISQERINDFARCTEDHNYIHVDPEKAKTGPFGQTVAHGFLTLSMLSRMAATGTWIPEGATMSINYGFNRIRFIDPVPSGSRIRMVMKLTGLEKKENGKMLMTVTLTVSAENAEKPALIAEWLTLYLT